MVGSDCCIDKAKRKAKSFEWEQGNSGYRDKREQKKTKKKVEAHYGSFIRVEANEGGRGSTSGTLKPTEARGVERQAISGVSRNTVPERVG